MAAQTTKTTGLSSVAIVPVNVQGHAQSLPKCGRSLMLLNPSNEVQAPIYRGCPIPALATIDAGPEPKYADGSMFAGLVWHTQPKQVVAHRGIALVAVVTQGYAPLDPVPEHLPVVPGSPLWINNRLVGITLSNASAYLTGSFVTTTTT